jgi:hypothetical protein
LSVDEQRLHRSMQEALRQLKQLQTGGRERCKTEMDDAIRLLETQQTKGLLHIPNETGFAHESAEIAIESGRPRPLSRRPAGRRLKPV